MRPRSAIAPSFAALALGACIVRSGPAPTSASPAPAASAPAPAAPTPANRPAAMTIAGRLAEARPQDPPPFVSTPEPRERPVEHPRGAALGVPKEMHESHLEGLSIWHDERGSGWHLRTSTRGEPRRFGGRVWLSEGSFADVRPSRTEWSDRLRATGRAIEFDFRTQGGVDGFEFRVTGARCVHFALSMDGRDDVEHVYIGAQGAHPARHAFTLCP
jgi:hypothetical protein